MRQMQVRLVANDTAAVEQIHVDRARVVVAGSNAAELILHRVATRAPVIERD